MAVWNVSAILLALSLSKRWKESRSV